MALCGWASIDENGHIKNGKAGDQKQTSSTYDTKGEVKLGNWYDFGQTFVIRYKDENKAKIHAKALKSLCNNANVGYDQNGRGTCRAELKKIGLKNYENLSTKCEVDCSSLQDLCAEISGAISTNVATGGMKNAYKGNENFIILTDKKYLTSGDYLLAGDISVAPYKHTIGSIENGSKSENETRGKKVSVVTETVKYYPQYKGTSTSIVDALKSVGEKDTSLANRIKIAKANGLKVYNGDAKSNAYLLDLLKKGKLVII